MEIIRIANEVDKLIAGAGVLAGDIKPSIPVWIIVAAIAAVVLIIVGIVYLATSD